MIRFASRNVLFDLENVGSIFILTNVERYLVHDPVRNTLNSFRIRKRRLAWLKSPNCVIENERLVVDPKPHQRPFYWVCQCPERVFEIIATLVRYESGNIASLRESLIDLDKNPGNLIEFLR